MSGYLELARRSRSRRRNESGSRPASEAVADAWTTRQNRPVHLGREDRRLKAAGFWPKERGGKTIWQRPDTGFWVSREMALHLLSNSELLDQERGTRGRVTQRGYSP